MSFTIKVCMSDMDKQEMYKPLVDENGLKFMLVPKDTLKCYMESRATVENELEEEEEEEEENDNPCQWCGNNLNEEEQANFETNDGNWVAWCGLDKYATCDDCMATMCEVCKGPCDDICDTCEQVCHSYECNDMSLECEHRCTCNNPPKDGLEPPDIDSLEIPRDIPFEITLDNLNKYPKKRLQDENVKYGLARCENETKDKTINKLTGHFEKLSKNKTCTLKLDDDQVIEYVYPEGKSRLDLNKIINNFFKS